MLESFVIFSLTVLGSMVCLSADVARRFVIRRSQGQSLAAGPDRDESAASIPPADPVVSFGFIVFCYGAIALALVSALPGALALERSGLAFALLCVGGIVYEIANSRSQSESSAADEDEADLPPQPMSIRLSVALTLTLNLAFAVLCSGQSLIEIVPPKTSGTGLAQELDPIVVISARASDSDRRTEEP